MKFHSSLVGISLALVVSTWSGPMAMADAVPPVRVLVKELPSGAFDIHWSVPKVIPAPAMPSPQLPENCRPDGERTFVDQPSAWLTRQVFRCPEGLSGKSLGIRFPTYNLGLSTLLRVEFQSGDQYAHMLNPGEDSWQVPEAHADGISSFLREAQQAVIDGIDHFFSAWVHLAFVFVVCMLGGARFGVRLATAFLLAQAAAVVLGSVLGVQLAAPLAEIGVALAAVLLAREALRPVENRTQLTVLAVCAGVTHGLGIQNLVPLAEPSVLYFLLVVLGMDAAFLIAATVVSGIGRLVPSSLARSRFATATVYGIAGASFALAIGILVNGPAVAATDSEPKLQLPSMMTPGGTALVGSRRVASNTPDAAIQSFLAIEAFEVRHEILVRPSDVAVWVGIGPEPYLAIEDQDDVEALIRELVLDGASLEIDGTLAEPVSERVDFMTLDAEGALPRSAPVPELVESAWVGVTAVYLTKTTAQEVVLAWDFDGLIGAAPEIPATVTDPESSVSMLLTPSEPILSWNNALADDPVPSVTAVAVEPAVLTVPLWSLAPLAAALFFAVAAMRRRWPAFSPALARVMVVSAVLLGPFGNAAIALPFSVGSAPGPAQAKLILARVLPNIYRAFEFREESAAFDRLALSVTGDTLTEIYLNHRQVLEMEERGGARARVEAVEILDVDHIEPVGDGGFTADATWTVGGTVTHFGHRHFRQNRFDARVAIVPDQNVWKVRSIEVVNEERLR